MTTISLAADCVMTVEEVAAYLRVNQLTIYRLAVERRLPGFKVGTSWRFKRVDIDRWIVTQSEVTSEPAPGKGNAE